MISFGIDPGSIRTGWGAVALEGNRLRWLDCGVIQAPRNATLSDRIDQIFTELCEAMLAHRPDRVFLESMFHQKFPRSAIVLAHARGVALLAARRSGAEIDELAPTDVKKSVTGSGRADKDQVQDMVRVLLGTDARWGDDASDALAVAIAGASRSKSRLVLAGRGARTR